MKVTNMNATATVDSREFRTNMCHFLNLCRYGERDLILTRFGKPVARVVSLGKPTDNGKPNDE
jgi:antitoxin (DNA-binding transcriptional repressor) of toxin-antitoxin stability system